MPSNLKHFLATVAISTLFAAAVATPVFAAEPKAGNDLSQWATALPATIDGVKVFPIVEEDGALNVSEIIDFPGRSQDRIFVNMFENIQREFDDNLEQIDNLDIADRKLLIHRHIPDPNAAGVAYDYNIALQTTDEMLVFLVYDINISYREKGVVPLTRAIAKLNPRENRKHKELVEGFALSLGNYIKDLQNAVVEDKSATVSHWTEIGKHQVVKGMNPTEVIMALGMPNSERKTGNRVKWMYGNENVIIFTDGVVSNVI